MVCIFVWFILVATHVGKEILCLYILMVYITSKCMYEKKVKVRACNTCIFVCVLNVYFVAWGEFVFETNWLCLAGVHTGF